MFVESVGLFVMVGLVEIWEVFLFFECEVWVSGVVVLVFDVFKEWFVDFVGDWFVEMLWMVCEVGGFELFVVLCNLVVLFWVELVVWFEVEVC